VLQLGPTHRGRRLAGTAPVGRRRRARGHHPGRRRGREEGSPAGRVEPRDAVDRARGPVAPSATGGWHGL